MSGVVTLMAALWIISCFLTGTVRSVIRGVVALIAAFVIMAMISVLALVFVVFAGGIYLLFRH